MNLQHALSLLVFIVFTPQLVLTEVENEVCLLYSTKNFMRSPILSVETNVKVFEVGLVLNLPTGRGLNVQSVKFSRDNCSVILCDGKHLQGNCQEISDSNSDLTLLNNGDPFRNVKSVDCRCSYVGEHSNAEEFVVVQSSRIKQDTPCSSIFKDWHYHGRMVPVPFPGSAIRLGSAENGIDKIRSISVKDDGCKLMLWGFNESSSVGNEFIVDKSVPFMNNEGSMYDWACCYCDECSKDVCQQARSSSKSLSSSIDNSNDAQRDFSQFVKYGKKIIGIGRNYRWTQVAIAQILAVPKEPIVFLKPKTSYITEGQLIELPSSLGTIFYELELGVVIGKKGRHISESKALDHVAGYFLALDMTAKEFVTRSGSNTSLPWEIGKGFDTACPVGNFIPKSYIPNPNNVDLECYLNGNKTQSDNTKNMIFNVEKLISYVSSYMTLEPYDVILTGTPDGFGPLKGGDVLEGRLGNLTSIKFTAAI